MHKSRLEAFSDGVIAIALTIMVLELKVPAEVSWVTLAEVAPHLAGYLLSFVFIAIYWNNHHHMLHVTRKVNGAILWANNHLLFWLTLVPFVTAMMGQHPLESLPLALYGAVLLMAGVAYNILTVLIVRHNGADEALAQALGTGWKGLVSVGCYASAVVLAFFVPLVSQLLYVAVAVLWFLPDRRIERHAEKDQGGS